MDKHGYLLAASRTPIIICECRLWLGVSSVLHRANQRSTFRTGGHAEIVQSDFPCK
ncbi:hypothetical protein RK21_02064 [Pseudomonas plecoglossicida]|nr:hypothetical protein RK21_02064 [Pseudomonas plecoglossicida]